MPDAQIIYPDANSWNAFVDAQPAASILQHAAWGELKSRFGWSVERVAVTRDDHIVAGAQILFRPLPLRLGTLAYIPRGPLLDWRDADLNAVLWRGVDALARRKRAALLKIEPDTYETQAPAGFRPSPHTIQPPRTIVIDLTCGEDELLAAMHHKTRYNIRLSARKGVMVREAERSDLPAFNALMHVTGIRDAFGVHSAAYYETAFDLFAPQGRAKLFLAEVEAQVVAALFAFVHGRRAWYFYGASGETHREYMPNHALQWQAIRWAKSLGCREYDLWGIPDADEATLAAQYLSRNDGLWGVYRFKRGFGGQVVRFAGAFDRVYNPLLYQAYLLVAKYRGSD
jgi:lipid II:glycine glycyltransferase (peptidoglycan interpeptide bridge formation enzyme)